MLNFFENPINIDVIIVEGNMEIIYNGRIICKGSIDSIDSINSCIRLLRREIDQVPSSSSIVLNIKNRSSLSSGLVSDISVITNKLHVLASSARCAITIHRGLGYNS